MTTKLMLKKKAQNSNNQQVYARLMREIQHLSTDRQQIVYQIVQEQFYKSTIIQTKAKDLFGETIELYHHENKQLLTDDGWTMQNMNVANDIDLIQLAKESSQTFQCQFNVATHAFEKVINEQDTKETATLALIQAITMFQTLVQKVGRKE